MSFKTLTAVISGIALLCGCNGLADFSKNIPPPNPDPKGWIADNPLCGGRTQSPIAIDTSSVVSNPSIGPFMFNDGISTAFNQGELKMRNTGNDVKIDGFPSIVSVDGGGLPAQYRLQQFHFHWGSDSTIGSEHTIDGRVFPLELHFVFFSTEYQTFGDAANRPYGLAVLGVLFELGETNVALQPLVDLMSQIRTSDAVVSLPSLSLRPLLPADLRHFVRYRGSLTTPPCYSSVVWTVFKDYLQVSEAQLNAFRNLLSSQNTPLVDNFRPVQPINARLVEECEVSSQPSSEARFQPKSRGVITNSRRFKAVPQQKADLRKATRRNRVRVAYAWSRPRGTAHRNNLSTKKTVRLYRRPLPISRSGARKGGSRRFLGRRFNTQG